MGSNAEIGDPENAMPLIERVVDEARTALCAEAVGLMDESLKITVDHLKVCKQFGVLIGSFQSLQDPAADMFVALERPSSMSMFATMATGVRRWRQTDESGIGGKSANRQERQIHWSAIDSAARRHRHDSAISKG